MTEIKLMNYGRGAGKTFTLNKWALEKPGSRVVITTEANRESFGDLRAMDLYNYGLSPYRTLAGRKDLEVAFDDFKIESATYRTVLNAVLLHNPKTVILATNYEAMQTDASRELNKKFGLGARISADEFLLNSGFKVDKDGGLIVDGGTIGRPDKKIEGEVAEGIIKAAGDIGREYIKQHNAKLEGIKLSPEFAEGYAVPAATVPEESHLDSGGCGEVEPIQKVKAKDLRIGDWVEGKGYVRTLSAASQAGYVNVEVVEEDKSGLGVVFRGNYTHIHGNVFFDVDITKRK